MRIIKVAGRQEQRNASCSSLPALTFAPNIDQRRAEFVIGVGMIVRPKAVLKYPDGAAGQFDGVLSMFLGFGACRVVSKGIVASCGKTRRAPIYSRSRYSASLNACGLINCEGLDISAVVPESVAKRHVVDRDNTTIAKRLAFPQRQAASGWRLASASRLQWRLNPSIPSPRDWRGGAGGSRV